MQCQHQCLLNYAVLRHVFLICFSYFLKKLTYNLLNSGHDSKKDLCFIKQKMKSLKNKLLISMPNMVDSYFAKSVIFICEDDANGTMGIIVNKPISQMKIINAGIKNKIF
mgnify:CR=1 FL=1